MRKIKSIVFHCTGSDNPMHDSYQIINAWHTRIPPWGNGWKYIGYHFLILKNGYCHTGRPIEITPASVKHHNLGTIAICLTGNHAFSQAQFDTAIIHTKDLMKQFSINKDNIYPHNYFNPNKTCPNYNIKIITDFL